MSRALNVFLFSSQGWGSVALEQLVAQGYQVVGVCCQAPHSLPQPIRQLARSLFGLNGRVFYYRDPLAHFPHPRQLARRYGIPWLDPTVALSTRGARLLYRLRPEVAFVCGFPRRIPAGIFLVPSLGTINFHPSLLPAHRGGTPTRWVIFHGERATGVTAHLLTEEWDAGDILCAKELAVGTQEDWGSLEVRSIALAAGLMCKVAETLAAGQRFTPRPQDPDLATYERPFRQSDSVMDWEEPLELTLRRCRAAKPKWGGFFGLHGKLFCVWSVEPAEMSGVVAAPGTITQVSPGRWLEIACRNGALRITRLLSGQGRLVGIPHRAGNRTIRSGDRCELSTVVRRWLSPQGDPEPAAAVVAGHRATVGSASR